ncbi:unnamed protein product [Caretta caretta]
MLWNQRLDSWQIERTKIMSVPGAGWWLARFPLFAVINILLISDLLTLSADSARSMGISILEWARDWSEPVVIIRCCSGCNRLLPIVTSAP